MKIFSIATYVAAYIISLSILLTSENINIYIEIIFHFINLIVVALASSEISVLVFKSAVKAKMYSLIEEHNKKISNKD